MSKRGKVLVAGVAAACAAAVVVPAVSAEELPVAAWAADVDAGSGAA